jgi:hypothetical protein
MIAQQVSPSQVKLVPESPEEAFALESWGNREVKVINKLRTFDQQPTGIILEFGNERP